MTPFVEGRFAAGVLGGRVDGAITIGNKTLSDTSVATWIYGGGFDGGIEVYAFRRAYVSAAIGWVRTTWQGVDYAAMVQNPTGGMRYRELTGDSVTFKLGLGI